MGKIILVTGGARSGKSAYAESLLANHDNVLYIATAIPFDEEMKDRIRKHRSMRNPKWETVDAYKDLDKVIAQNSGDRDAIFFDCITMMVNNLMLVDRDLDWDNISTEEANEVEDAIMEEAQKFIEGMKKFEGETVVVTNELGMGIVPLNPIIRYYRDITGRVNQSIAHEADEVIFVVSGIPMKIKEGGKDA